MNSFPEVATEVFPVAGDEVCGLGDNRAAKDRPVFIGKLDRVQDRFGCRYGMNQLKRPHQSLEALRLGTLCKVTPCLIDDVGGGAQDHALKRPEDGDPSILAVGRGKQDIGVQKKPIHWACLLRTVVLN